MCVSLLTYVNNGAKRIQQQQARVAEGGAPPSVGEIRGRHDNPGETGSVSMSLKQKNVTCVQLSLLPVSPHFIHSFIHEKVEMMMACGVVNMNGFCSNPNRDFGLLSLSSLAHSLLGESTVTFKPAFVLAEVLWRINVMRKCACLARSTKTLGLFSVQMS